MGGAADKAGNRFERRWTLVALLDLLDGKAQSLQVEVPGEEGAGAEFLQVMADGVPVWHQVKRQQASGSWTIRSLVSKNVVAPWWPKISSGGRFVFVSSTSAQGLAELAERASAAESRQVFDEHFLTSPHRDRFELLRRAWGNPPAAEVYAALRRIEVRQIGESDLRDMVETRLRALVDGSPSTTMAVLEQLIDESTHHRLTAPDVWRRLAEHDLRPAAQTGASGPGGPRGQHVQSGSPLIQRAEGSGSAQVTQIGHVINIHTSGSAPRRKRVLFGSGGAVVLIAVVAAIVAFTGNHAPSRLPAEPLTGQPTEQLQTVRIPIASLHGKLAQMFGSSGAATSGIITGYEFRNAWNQSIPVCLGVMDTGATIENADPVLVSRCDGSALNEIWIPAQWEQSHERFTWLVNGEYQSMCLNVDMNAGNGTHAQLWNCYYNSSGPDGLAVNEAWDFGTWYTGMTSGINPYPIFLGSGDFCLAADNENADPSENDQLPDGTAVTMWDYYHVARNQYWS